MAISPDTGSSPRQLNFYQQVAIKLPCPPLAQDLVSTIRAQFPLPITRPRASISNLRSICLAYHSVSLANGSPKFQGLAPNLPFPPLAQELFSTTCAQSISPTARSRTSFSNLGSIYLARRSPRDFFQQFAFDLPLAQGPVPTTCAQFALPTTRHTPQRRNAAALTPQTRDADADTDADAAAASRATPLSHRFCFSIHGLTLVASSIETIM